MSTATHPPAVASAPLPPPSEVYRLTVDQFDRMVRDGTLGEDEPVELLNGVLVKTMPKNPAPTPVASAFCHEWSVAMIETSPSGSRTPLPMEAVT